MFFNLHLDNASIFWPDDYNTVLKITFKDFQEFSQRFKEYLFIEVLGVGDVDKDSSLKIAKAMNRIISYDPLPRCWDLGNNSPLEVLPIIPNENTILELIIDLISN